MHWACIWFYTQTFARHVYLSVYNLHVVREEAKILFSCLHLEPWTLKNFSPYILLGIIEQKSNKTNTCNTLNPMMKIKAFVILRGSFFLHVGLNYPWAKPLPPPPPQQKRGQITVQHKQYEKQIHAMLNYIIHKSRILFVFKYTQKLET